MFYVYCYIDPRSNQPFYIGKGKQNRAFDHLRPNKQGKNKNKTRFLNKIGKIRSEGLEPIIIFLEQNIKDEDNAYKIEEKYIKKYGRKDYDHGGILMNICESSRPPNHKGKTYADIYGDYADEQREKRRDAQIKAGGYGPANHSLSTRKKISESVKEFHSNRDCSHSEDTKKKIGAANSKYVGSLNKKSKKITLFSPNGKVFELYGYSELSKFCEANNLNLSSFKAAIHYNRNQCVKGKNKGWGISH